MRVNVNVLIGFLLCVLILCVVGVMRRVDENQDAWHPNEIYTHLGGSSYTSSSVSSHSSDGVVVAMRGVSRPSRRYVAVPAFSYAPTQYSPIASTQYSIGGTPSNSVASPVYTTSSATMKSFGAGMAAGGGMSVSGGSVRNSQSPVANSQSLIAYSQLPVDMYASAYRQSDVEPQFIANAYMSGLGVDVGASVPMYNGLDNSTAGGISGMNGRRGLGEDMGSTYDSWLNWFNKFGWAYGLPDGNHYYYDDAKLRAAYEAWIATLSPGVPRPSYEDWLSWFASGEHYHEGGNKYFSFVPVGDVWPLIVLIMLYTLFIVIRKSFKTTCI